MLAVALVGIVFIFALWQRQRATWFRILAAVFAILLLLNPNIVREERQGLSDIALILVDDSESQSVAQRQQISADALAALTEMLDATANMEYRVVRVRGQPGGAGRPGGTRLTEAMHQQVQR